MIALQPDRTRQPVWIEPTPPVHGLPVTVIARGADTSSTHGSAVTPLPPIPPFDTAPEETQ